MTTPDGAQAERTGLAWRRTALASAACTVLLLHAAAQRHWGGTVVPALLAAGTSALLAGIGMHRERALRAAEPGPPSRVLPAIVSLAVTATAASVLIFH
ncbi:Uncharacterized membrane protein YidH, DUF202 family [Amycolatopsis tolypomycina]|uniref:Uncharacterized membrane protein YidH, DUF202 family n=1 Tax=Amycolatopsis tolypomycina TaxID=208445 RepID=A0A1H4PTA3_9PSEU|nr:DUF202 domain-containing protein [Amycolatopsis tolypomycina]SEC10606.1 Uncharacterized membrane protein YidH, DUF202 family [Amycolatopsis tolypomycina]